MNRQAAITRARNLIRQRAVQKTMTPVVSVDQDGNYVIKIGKGGILIRLARSSGDDSPVESEPGGVTPEGEAGRV